MEETSIVVALAALAQVHRLAAFRALVQAGPDGLSAGALAAALSVPAPTLSFHLKELRLADLVESRSSGRFVIYRARFDRLGALLEYLTENCCRGMPGDCVATLQRSLSACGPAACRLPSSA